MIENFKGFRRINEEEEEDPFRLYGKGSTPEAELIAMLKNLISDIKRMHPSTQDEYDSIKNDIKNRIAEIKGHKNYSDLKDGIPWQDTFIKLSDWSNELKSAVSVLNTKISKKGFN